MNTDRYISLIQKEILKDISDKEVKELSDWRASEEKHERLYQEINQAWIITDHYPTDVEVDTDIAFEKVQQRIRPSASIKTLRSNHRNLWMSMAAGVALFLGVLCFLPRDKVSITDSKTIIATIDNETIELPDGSTVKLRKGSSLTYDKSFINRHLTLNGSGFFDVKRDELRPFVISSHRSKVTVLGTKFIYADDGVKQGYLKMVSGRVELSVGDEQLHLRRFEGAYFADGELSKRVSAEEYQWYRPSFSYQDVPLRHVITELESYYQVDVDVDPAILGCSFSGKLSSVEVGESLSVIAGVYNSSILYDGKKYSVDGGSCQ